MRFSKEKIKQFQDEILSWYEVHKRELPWRNLPENIAVEDRAYRILVSEVMSQQTQIQRVVMKYQQWLEKFPTIEALSNATIADVLLYWSGLGYNRRALNLKKTAEIIVKKLGTEFPKDEKMLRSLPGIGEYTSRAILCFAFNQQVTVIDTNVRKVILTQFSHSGNGGQSPSSPASEARQGWNDEGRIQNPDSGRTSFARMTEKEIQDIAEQLLPKGQASEWNQALMDYAATVLKKEKIPIPKQSTFIGSHRYYRGQVLKILLQKKEIPVGEVGFLIKKDYKDKEREWLENLLQKLDKEGFIIINKQMIALRS